MIHLGVGNTLQTAFKFNLFDFNPYDPNPGFLTIPVGTSYMNRIGAKVTLRNVVVKFMIERDNVYEPTVDYANALRICHTVKKNKTLTNDPVIYDEYFSRLGTSG